MNFQLLESVVLTRDLPSHALLSGDLGAVVEIHDDTAFEVEFVTVAGATQALVTLAASDIRHIDATDLLTMRRLNDPT